MVRLLDLIDLDARETTRKSLSYKRHEGLEAPRNRSEKPAEASCSFCVEGDDILCSTYHMTNDWPEKKNCYVNEVPMKKLINEELAKRPNTGQNAPSVVARLMGLDTLSSRQTVFDSFDRRSSNSLKFNKSKPREHPQEEELQKFKKEFEAYQSARFKECSEFVELSTNTDRWMSQRHFNKEKMVLYANSMRKTVTERSVTENIHENGISKVQKDKNELLAAARNKTNRAMNFKSGTAAAKIVVLRPVSDMTGKNEESWTDSPRISEDGSSMEEFLQEVKERLKFELQEKSFRKNIEKPSDAKIIAQCIAKQARESVTRDVGTTLHRSESMQSYRSELQRDEADTPELTHRDTRRILTEKLRNVLRDKSSHDIDKHDRVSFTSVTQNRENSRAEEEIRYASNEVCHAEDLKGESDMQSRYSRQERGNDVILDQKLFHRNLVRSLSAPVSRSSFGKLLMEDQDMLTGVHIRRKHEAIEEVTMNVKKWRKEKFNFKEKVSSFKYSFILKGKLFGRKIQSLEESHGDKQIHMKDLQSTQTIASKFYVKQENSTEVPPSPASVCSTTNEEFWRQTDYFSPSSSSSISDVNPLDDSEIPHVFKEISSNLNEIRRQLNQLETYDSEETMIDEEPIEEETMEIDDPSKAFIRDMLVASGLYDGSCDRYLLKWDPLGKFINNQVFEEVEESYKIQKTNADEEGSSADHHEFKKLNHKLLCDFLNEVLPSVLGSNSMKRTISPTTPRAPWGKKLLEYVWEIARVYSDMSSQSLETILARDLQCTRWDGLVDEDVNALGKDVEYQIVGDLIHEMINDM